MSEEKYVMSGQPQEHKYVTILGIRVDPLRIENPHLKRALHELYRGFQHFRDHFDVDGRYEDIGGYYDGPEECTSQHTDYSEPPFWFDGDGIYPNLIHTDHIETKHT